MLARTLGSQHRLRLDIESPVWPVRGNAHQLEVALINLAANGRDAMPDGGTLTVGLRNEPEGPRSGRVVLFVTDEGSGMTAEQVDRVFEPFFTTRRDRGGTGLGLTTVRRVAERHGGEVRVESVVGVGTTLEVVVPRVAGGLGQRAVREP